MDIIEIAKECGASCVHAQNTVIIIDDSELQQFAQRIEAPLQQQIAQLERALQAAQFSTGVADDLLADLKHAKQQIEQLREALKESALIAKSFIDGYEDLANSVGTFPAEKLVIKKARKKLKALEETK